MKSIGFPMSKKENEYRRAILPVDIHEITHPEFLFFEEGYGNALGYSDQDYIDMGCNVVSREEVLSKEIICDPKIGDAEYLNKLSNQTIFGWVHAVQNRDITDKLIENKLTAYAWEDMFEMGKHTFWKNNEIAGEAAVMHAFLCIGDIPNNKNVALIGRGNVAMGALKMLASLGANVVTYNKYMEGLLRKEIDKYDVIVNALLWDTTRKDHIIYESDLERMKKNSLIIDISCDAHGAIETSVPTPIENPIYVINGVTHYVVDHTPSLVYKYASREISKSIIRYLNFFIEEKRDDVLNNALIMENGNIIDQRINKFQNR